DVTLGPAVGLANPLGGFVGVVQAEVVVDRLGGEHAGDLMTQGLHAVERAVAADADESVDLKPAEAVGDPRGRLGIGGVDAGRRGGGGRGWPGRGGGGAGGRMETGVRGPRGAPGVWAGR